MKIMEPHIQLLSALRYRPVRLNLDTPDLHACRGDQIDDAELIPLDCAETLFL